MLKQDSSYKEFDGIPMMRAVDSRFLLFTSKNTVLISIQKKVMTIEMTIDTNILFI